MPIRPGSAALAWTRPRCWRSIPLKISLKPSAGRRWPRCFRRALDGEPIDRAPLRHHTPDGRVLEFELSLSQRQKAGNPLAVRCLLRDVTQQKQREHRLALQLVSARLSAKASSPEVAAMRILEALCISQGWDVAIKWEVDAKAEPAGVLHRLGRTRARAETLIQESMGRTLAGGEELPGRAWKEGRAVWIADLSSASRQPPH